MRGRVKLVEGMRFFASADSSAGIVMDSGTDEGEVLGPSPMETVMLAAGCCSAMDIVHILEKMRQPPQDLEIGLEAERAEEDPRVFTSLRIHYRLKGGGLKKDSVERAISLSVERYCSVSIMLKRAGVRITTSFEILQ
ncbi:MAG: OsmC family protein [Thermoplasmata archaeon]